MPPHLARAGRLKCFRLSWKGFDDRRMPPRHQIHSQPAHPKWLRLPSVYHASEILAGALAATRASAVLQRSGLPAACPQQR
eukprot:3739149-Amphidinium_carterae.1